MRSLSGSSLRNRILRSGAWSLFGHATSQAIRLGSSLIMTRLLMPEMFGVMAIANVILFGIALFSDLGLRQNIIQSRRGHDPVFLNTVWSVQIIRGALLWCIAVLIGLMLYFLNQTHILQLNGVYSEPILPWVIGTLALSALISGFESTKLASASRNLLLGKITLIDLASQIGGLLTMLAWIYIDRSIWALVAGGIFSSIVKTVLSHTALPGENNKLHWDAESFYEIFHFGKWIFLTSIMGFLINSIDRLLLGGLISAEALGVYSIAVLLSGAFQEVVSKLTGSVAFPALGEIKRLQPDRVKELYYKIRLPIDTFCLFFAGFLFLTGEIIVSFLYDSRYITAGKLLEILSLSLLSIRYNVVDQFYMVLGKPKIMAFIIAIRLVFLTLFLPIGYWLFALEGAAWGIVIAWMLGSLVTLFHIKRKIGLLDLSKELRTLIIFPIGLLIGEAVKFLWNTILY
ncbi:MAG: oligosaccharide flippase family protein [Methylotenera sp.]|nr:oligosaccharide flippase family protein [Methylotenera sp.]